MSTTRTAGASGTTLSTVPPLASRLIRGVATTRETVTKVLGDLATRRLVNQRRGRVIITDRAGLRHLATHGGLNPTTGGHRA